MNEPVDTVYINDLADLFAHDHSLILTPNQRLSQQIQLQSDRLRRQTGEKSWPARPVMAINSWLQSVWDNATAAGYRPCNEYWVLSTAEELELWRRAMLASLENQFIAQESAAQQLMQAWQVLCNWGLDIQSSELRSKFTLNDNCAFFLKVCEQVLDDCHNMGAVCSAQIPGLLTDIEAPMSGRILLYGFEELLPAHQVLLERWGNPTSTVQLQSNSSQRDQPLQLTQAATFEAEVSAAAHWAHAIVSDNSSARVAVIVPQLETRRGQIESCFESVFDPKATNPFSKRQVPPFNISAGVSLASTPLVQSALTLLRLLQSPIASSDLPHLLYSPFYSHWYGADRGELYRLEHRLRAYGNTELSMATILREAEYLCDSNKSRDGVADSCVEILLRSLSDCRRLSRDQVSGPFDDHLNLFTQQLSAIGWPGSRSADSVEYQQLSSFTSAINSCQALAAVRFRDRQKVTAKESLILLEHVLRTEVFQAQSSDTRVQILGLLEGAGLPFTHVRLCDFSLGQWPASPSPSSYIPYALQREMRMPHCDALREADFSQRLFQRYLQQTQHLSCSYALDEGATEVLPSTLLRKLETAKIEPDREALSSASQTVPAKFTCTPPNAGSAGQEEPLGYLPVAAQEDIRGTTSLLTDQAACPFRAFTRHRLHVRRFESAQLGIDSRDRGIILHDAMEAFWREANDVGTLARETDVKIQRRVDEAVGSAIASAKRRLIGREACAYLDVEAIRLCKLMFAWLQNEAQRSPFSVVDLEYAIDTEIAGRPARLRVDRVDRLEDGSLLLLEYKSGAVSEKDSMDQPLLAPQLALYLQRYRSSSGEHAVGGAICKLDDQGSAWIGAGRAKYVDMPLQRRLLKYEQDTDTHDELWAEQTLLWEREIERLEQSFSDGDTQINPVKGLQTCRYCDYSSICRYAVDGAGA